MNIRLITVVWGESFVRLFLRVSVRTLLADGNIAALAARHSATYTIFTTAEDAERLRQSPLFARLQAAVTVEFAIFKPNEIDLSNPYSHWELWHRGLALAQKNNEVLFVIIPDTLFGAGVLTNWAKHFEAGAKAVWSIVHQGVLESMLTEIEHNAPGDAPLDIPIPEIQRLFIKHMHPYAISMFRDSPRTGQHPESVFAPVNGQGLIMRAIVSHLFCVDPNYFSLTDALSPTDHLDAIAFEESGAVCLEPLLKNVHLVYRPASMDETRLSNLGSWIDYFCGPADVLTSGRNFRFLPAISDEAAVRRAEQSLGFYACQTRITGAIFRVVRALRGAGCGRAAQWAAATHYVGRLRRHWSIRGPVTVFAPNDAALSALQGFDLLKHGNERQLAAAALAHIRPGELELKAGDAVEGPQSSGARVVAGPFQVDDCTIYVVDRLLPFAPDQSANTESRKTDHLIRWASHPQRILKRATDPATAPPQTIAGSRSVTAILRDIRRSLLIGIDRQLTRFPALRKEAHRLHALRRGRQMERSARNLFGNFTEATQRTVPQKAVTRLQDLQSARIALNLQEILRFHANKVGTSINEFPNLQDVDSCIESAGLNLGRIERELTHLVDVTPDFAEAWLELGYLHADRKDHDKAASCFERSLRSRTALPASPATTHCYVMAAFAHASALLAANKPDDAARSFAKAVALAPRTGGPERVAYGLTLLQLRQYEPALDQFEAGMTSDEMRPALPKLPRDFPSFASLMAERFDRQETSR